jgi:predicted KAP-like P-loop ATPase
MWSDNETSEDLLGFKVHADLIIDVINDDTILPITIGVFGDWGSGKSSILKIINDSLKEDGEELQNGVLVLYFNGWLFEGYDDAKAALLESIIKAFESNKSLTQKVKDSTTKLLKSVNWMRMLSLSFKNVVVPTVTAYLSGGLSLIPFLAGELSKIDSKELGEKLTGEEGEKFLKSILREDVKEEEIKSVRSFRKEFRELIEKSEIKKLVVLIDDLDRCTPERVIENLEAIKLFLNVEKTAFVIGADPRIVRHAIEFRYKVTNKSEDDANSRIVDDYLEKLIQIPYNLPKLSESEVETYISLLIAKRELPIGVFNKVVADFNVFREKDKYSVYGLASIKQAIAIDDKEPLSNSLISMSTLVPIITQTLSGNPRQIKRFLNTFMLRKRLAKVANISDFSEAVLTKLMALEYSEPSLFRQLYDLQVVQKGVPEELSKMEEIAKTAKNNADLKVELEKVEGTKLWNKERAMNWLRVEPLLGALDLSDYFWLSRDKISSTIPGSGLISPHTKSLYQLLNQASLSDAVSKRIIKEKIAPLASAELTSFLEFSSQMLLRNPKTMRGYNIFHLLIDENILQADQIYATALLSINLNETPIAIGEALRRYENTPSIKLFIDSVLSKSSSQVAKAYKK